ncbi:MAG TPA: hypothetical protein VF824_15770 [Thermoanaerobaculia bacterium]
MRNSRRLACLAFLFATSLAAAPERQVGTPVYDVAPGVRTSASVASDGDGFLAVWRDERGPAAGIVGTRVTASGEVVDPTGLRIATGGASYPQVLWTGDEYMVIYQLAAEQVWMVRVTRDGVVSSPRLLARDAARRGAATNGNVTVVTYAGRVGSGFRGIGALVLDREGNVVRDIALTNAKDEVGDAADIASDGSGFLVAWNAFRSAQPVIEATRLDASGARVDATSTFLGEGWDPKLASDGTRYLLVARVRLQFENELVFAARTVDTTLQTGDWNFLPRGNLLSPATLLWNGSAYLLIDERAVARDLELVSMPIDRDAHPLRNAFAVLHTAPMTGELFTPAAATNGTNVFAVWTEPETFEGRALFNAPHRALGALLDRDGATLLAMRVLALSANRHASPAIASAGDQHLVAWREASGIYASRLAADGQPLDGRGILIDGGNAGDPAVAFDGRQYVIAYSTMVGDQLFATVRFVTRAGALRPQKLAIAAARQQFPMSVALAPDDRGTLLLWTAGAVRAAHIQRETLTVDIGPADVLPQSAQAGELAASWNGSEYLVVYSELDSPPLVNPAFPMPARIRATRVTASLIPRDPGTLLVGDHGHDADSSPRVSSDGRDWLVVWNDPDGVWSRRVLADGTMPGDIDGTRVSDGSFPDVEWNGASYTVAWKNRGPEGQLVQATIPRDGTPSAVGARLVSTTRSPANAIDLAITSRGPIVAYLKLATGPEFGDVERTFVRLLDDAPLPRVRAVRH